MYSILTILSTVLCQNFICQCITIYLTPDIPTAQQKRVLMLVFKFHDYIITAVIVGYVLYNTISALYPLIYLKTAGHSNSRLYDIGIIQCCLFLTDMHCIPCFHQTGTFHLKRHLPHTTASF